MKIPLLVLAGAALAGAAETAHGELAQQIFTYEPTYFALEPAWAGRPLNAKFQVSFAFRIAGPDTAPDPGPLRRDGWYVAYSQTSFWDLGSESKPFYDSSYRPESWYHVGLPAGGFADQLGLEPGIGHESNGRSGSESRSINHLFLRAAAAWRRDDLTLVVDPRVRTYIEKEDNPDIAEYRGYVDLHGSLIRDGSWGIALTGRIGSQLNRGSLMAELSHPMGPWTGGWLEGFLYVQSFTGWSETLVAYDRKNDVPRLLFGFAITR